MGRLLQKDIRELAGLGEPTGLERDVTDGWSGLNLMAMMVSVDFYLETKQERLPTPHPHHTVPPVLPVRSALPIVEPEVPSQF